MSEPSWAFQKYQLDSRIRMGQICSYVIGMTNRMIPMDLLPYEVSESGWVRFAEVEDNFISERIAPPTIDEVIAILVELLEPDVVREYGAQICGEIFLRLNPGSSID